jgi:hypothetical protein
MGEEARSLLGRPPIFSGDELLIGFSASKGGIYMRIDEDTAVVDESWSSN